MATQTFWVDGVTGDDGDDGSTPALAFATMAAATTAIDALSVAGDDYVLNVVNSGPYTMDVNESTVQLDMLTDNVVTVQGVDTSGNPALVSVVAPATGVCTFVYLRTCESATVKGFDVDFRPSVADASVQEFVAFRDTDHGPIVVEDCRFRGSALGGAMPAGSRRVMNNVGAYSTDVGEVRYCVLENMEGPVMSVGGSASLAFDGHHNAIIIDTTDAATTQLSVANITSASNDVRVYANTVYIQCDGDTSAWIDYAGAAGDKGRMDFYDNVSWFNSSNATPMPTGFVGGGSGGSFSSGTRGTNIFYTGPDITSVEAGNTYESSPWAGPYTGDVELYEQADTALFNDPSSTYDWAASGGGYTLTVGKDLRLIAQTSAGQSSGLPGALPSINVDISVDTGADDTGPDEGDSVLLTVVAENAGPSTESALVVSAPVPAGLTYVSDSATAGTYDDATGLWTLTLAASASATLSLTATVDTGTRGTSINFTSAVSSTSGTDTDSGNDTDTTILTIGQPQGSPTLPEYLDVLPFFAPVYELDFDPTLLLTVNGTTVDFVGFEVGRPDKRLTSEHTTRRIIIPASTTVNVNMGGVEKGRVLMIEASRTVNVGIGSPIASISWPVRAIALDTEFDELYIQNTDASNTATVQLVIVD